MLRKVEYDHINSDLKLCDCGCGEKIHSINKLGKPARFKQGHYAKISSPWKGSNHWCWKNGIRYDSHGYRLIWNKKHHFATKEGYVLEHRLVWEKHNKAILLGWNNWVDIHHKNKNILDNRIENLEVILHGEHSRYHRLH